MKNRMQPIIVFQSKTATSISGNRGDSDSGDGMCSYVVVSCLLIPITWFEIVVLLCSENRRSENSHVVGGCRKCGESHNSTRGSTIHGQHQLVRNGVIRLFGRYRTSGGRILRVAWRVFKLSSRPENVAIASLALETGWRVFHP